MLLDLKQLDKKLHQLPQAADSPAAVAAVVAAEAGNHLLGEKHGGKAVYE